MKFLCSNCKAKYQIPDEKIAGRTLKMDCRRCATPIVIRGDLGIPDDAPDAQEPAQPAARAPAASASTAASSTARRPGSATASRPLGAASAGGSSVGPHPTAPHSSASARGSVTGRGALGADFRRNVAAEPPRAVTPLDQWHVAINDVPVGPMKRDEISRKIAAGAVTGDSLAWREGFDDWRPLREIPELAALMRRATSESDLSSPRGGPRATAPRAPAPRASVSSSSAGTARPIATSARPAAARSNVVAIGGRLGASAAPAIDTDELHDASDGSDDAEPTTVASAADLGLADLAKPRAAPKSEPADDLVFAPPVDPMAASPAKAMRAEPAKAKPPSGSFKHAASGLGVPPRPEAKADAKAETAKAEPSRSSFAPPPPAALPAPVASPPFSAPPATVSPVSPVGPKPAAVPATPVVAAPERRQGMSVGALMGIGFAMAAGAVLMYGVVQRFLLTPAAPEAPVVTATIAPTVTPPEEQHVADVEVDTTTPPPTTPEGTTPATDPVVAVAPEATEHWSGTSSSTGARSASKAPSTSPTPSTPTPSTPTPPSSTGSSARFDQFADSPSGSGPAPIATSATSSGSHASSDSASGPRTELTEAQISEVRRREQRSLQTCWETAIRGMRDVGDVRMDIDITIGASGTVMSARARGPGVGSLSECIEQRVRRWHFPASSDTTQLTFPVVFSGQ